MITTRAALIRLGLALLKSVPTYRGFPCIVIRRDRYVAVEKFGYMFSRTRTTVCKFNLAADLAVGECSRKGS